MSNSKHYNKVRDFMLLAQQDAPIAPQTTLPQETRLLRARLILEEALETIQALGFNLSVHCGEPSPKDGVPITIQDAIFKLRENGWRLSQVIDGCCDLSVVTIGTLIAFGISDEVLDMVDDNNLAKFDRPCCPHHPQEEMELLDSSQSKIYYCCAENCSFTATAGYMDQHGKWIKPSTHKPVDFISYVSAKLLEAKIKSNY